MVQWHGVELDLDLKNPWREKIYLEELAKEAGSRQKENEPRSSA
jgi:hypothetical protein